ncbi:hypothetical protein Rumal_3291 (plasmid) [Ruminococcus albus 7 = DSM 20455]|jgi:hypothetical protein|uniref:Uncharacterized protein n=1 Tax=Ruminococcus albus (strain ATCC 27210 / DSM 20455 / JCM 14654 / NCDO 2250 / 7) TaxID=697329 RepID=E6UJA8_RUMA7|nr:hypothetical protein Rumal_3291 [Ruminococcus albus 7 = DSM 20455]
MADIIHSFIAFNVNAFNHLVYLLSQNISIIIILIAAVLTAVLSLKDVVVKSTRDQRPMI